MREREHLRTFDGPRPPTSGYDTYAVLLKDLTPLFVTACDVEVFDGYVRFDGPRPLLIFTPHVVSVQRVVDPPP